MLTPPGADTSSCSQASALIGTSDTSASPGDPAASRSTPATAPIRPDEHGCRRRPALAQSQAERQSPRGRRAECRDCSRAAQTTVLLFFAHCTSRVHELPALDRCACSYASPATHLGLRSSDEAPRLHATIVTATSRKASIGARCDRLPRICPVFRIWAGESAEPALMTGGWGGVCAPLAAVVEEIVGLVKAKVTVRNFAWGTPHSGEPPLRKIPEGCDSCIGKTLRRGTQPVRLGSQAASRGRVKL